MGSAHVQVSSGIDDPIPKPRAQVSEQGDMLIIIGYNGHAAGQSCSRANEPIYDSSKILPNVFVRFFNLKIARVHVPGQEAPVTDGADITP